MTEPTLADDLAALRKLADRLDPDKPWEEGPDDFNAADTLRRVHSHLERIQTGGDRPPPEPSTDGAALRALAVHLRDHPELDPDLAASVVATPDDLERIAEHLDPSTPPEEGPQPG